MLNTHPCRRAASTCRCPCAAFSYSTDMKPSAIYLGNKDGVTESCCLQQI